MSIVNACQKDDIPTKMIKMNKDIFAGFAAKDFNNCVDKGVFPDAPIHKKKDKGDKTNYRPVSILPNISKIYEKLFYNQLYDYFDDILISSQYGFRKGHSTRHCLLVMWEKVKESVDNGNEFALTDLSKAFDWINHKLQNYFGMESHLRHLIQYFHIFQIELNVLKSKQVTAIKLISNMELNKAQF